MLASLENKDIGFVHAGDRAEIKIHTFPFTQYGVVDATVTSVSDDALPEDERGLVYAVQLAMNDSTLMVDGRDVSLKPGMSVTAEIKTGKRRLLEFFLSPLLRYGNESIRER